MELELLGMLGKLLGTGGGWVALVWVLIRQNKRIQDGDLVPRKTHEDALGTIALQQARMDLQAETARDLADGLGTVQQFIEALPRPSESAARRPSRGGRS